MGSVGIESAHIIPHETDTNAMFDFEISRVAGRNRELSLTCPFGCFFLTDLHIPSNHGKSIPLLARLISETGLHTVVCGDDIPEAFGDRASPRSNPARTYNYFTDYTHTIAERSPGGTIRTLTPGKAVARATDGSRECIPVTVQP